MNDETQIDASRHGVSGDFGQLFDRDAEMSVGERARPHWMQDGTITYITMRFADSIPREVIQRWDRMRIDFLGKKGIACYGDWRIGREQLSSADRLAFEKQFRRLREDELDLCHGRCQLREPTAAKILADAFLFFDDEPYRLGDFVVMPNHTHMLVVFPDSKQMRKQCNSWMRFTATQINRLFGDKGTLWQAEPFDHLVRSETQLEFLREYIRDNPIKARLKEGEYLHKKSNRSY